MRSRIVPGELWWLVQEISCGSVTRCAVHLVGERGGLRLAAGAVELQRERRRVGRDPQQRCVTGRVALLRERRVDAEHADDRRERVTLDIRRLGAVEASVPGRVGRGQLEQVGAGVGRRRRRPAQNVPAGAERRGGSGRDEVPPAVGALDLQDQARGLAEREGDVRFRASALALGTDRRQHRTIACERGSAVRGLKAGQRRCGRVQAEHGSGENALSGHDPQHVAAVRHQPAEHPAVPRVGDRPTPSRGASASRAGGPRRW